MINNKIPVVRTTFYSGSSYLIGVVAFVLGRLAVKGIMNLLLGGTMFGGNFL